ncbi:SDR family NAD(P)-dependent oxidoreductase [Streptomyces sp. NPDC001652]|uniref:SDR family NAD(P)-dependent oxidoreductase n=1 Tax=Streptomyces sp. NPDC001652 TaxID=3154393 RepID=UPI00331C8846
MTRTLALTTGPSSDIGAASARLLADTSDAVLMACHVDRLQDLADELRKPCAAVKALPADHSTRDGTAMMRDRLSAGAVRLLISNVGVGGSAPLIDVDAAETDGSFTLNAEVHVQLADAALPGMLAAADGDIASLPAAGAGRAPQHPVHRGQAGHYCLHWDTHPGAPLRPGGNRVSPEHGTSRPRHGRRGRRASRPHRASPGRDDVRLQPGGGRVCPGRTAGQTRLRKAATAGCPVEPGDVQNELRGTSDSTN